MKPLLTMTVAISFALALSGCGLESAGTAAVAGKTKAEEARQGQQTVKDTKARIEKMQQDHQEARRKAEEQSEK